MHMVNYRVLQEEKSGIGVVCGGGGGQNPSPSRGNAAAWGKGPEDPSYHGAQL